jgi:anaerobic C4-dicarboxylate transporter DcuA
MMFWVHLLVVLVFIFIGARKGGIAIGFAGGAGVLALGLLGAPVAVSTHKPEGDISYLPLDVIAIIMAVIVAIAAMQVAGGMDALVDLAEKILRKNPKHLSFLAPVVTYVLTLMAGTGHTAFSMMPVITEVAKENDIRPSRPLSIAVVSSQIAITASPISAAVVFLSSTLEKKGIDYLQILAVSIPTTFVACMLTAGIMLAWDKMRHQTQLSTLPEYQQRKAAGLVAPTGREEGRVITWAGKRSVAIFLLGLLAVMAYSTAISDKVGLIANPPITRDAAIIAIMLTIGTAIVLTCGVEPGKILSSSVFKSGMSAAICVLGVAWLGTTFVKAHEPAIKEYAGNIISNQPWTLAIVLFVAASLLYSQAATTKALIPTALAIGVSPAAALASFAAVSALFVLPTYPTLLAAVEIDDTGSTKIGKYIFNHPFFIPGLVAIALSVAFAFLLTALMF